MRIANKYFLSRATLTGTGATVFVALSAFCLLPLVAHAADGLQPISATPDVLSVDNQASPLAISPTPAPASDPKAEGTSGTPAVAPAATLDLAKPDVASGAGKASGSDESLKKSIMAMEDKALSSAKSAVKRLDTGSDATTLDDLNRARQTVTRIEAMIELEKRMKELEKLRGERNDMSAQSAMSSLLPSNALMAALPASILTPSVTAPPIVVEEKKVKRSVQNTDRPEVVRIYGAGGKYTAVLKYSGKDEKTVKIGEKINDDDTVQAITASSVQIGNGKTSYTVSVKNIGVMQSAMR